MARTDRVERKLRSACSGCQDVGDALVARAWIDIAPPAGRALSFSYLYSQLGYGQNQKHRSFVCKFFQPEPLSTSPWVKNELGPRSRPGATAMFWTLKRVKTHE